MPAAATPIDVVPLTPARMPDLAALLEQGGDPKWCWCASFRVRSLDFTKAKPAENRAVLEADLERDADEGRAPGLIAYRDGVAIGWVSLEPRESFERLAGSRILAPVDDSPVWSIVCFVVGWHHRGQGVARELLRAAIDYARDHGATTIEAYPIELVEGKRIASANTYGGTLSMFRRAGFEVVARRKANAATRDRPIVRLAL